MRLNERIVRSIAFFSDMHIGDPYALNYWERLKTSKTTYYSPEQLNKGQREIIGMYQNALELCERFEIDTVCLLGDIIEGRNPTLMGPDLVDGNMTVQQYCAEHVLEPLVKDRQVHVVSGSRWHESKEYAIYSSLSNNLRQFTDEKVFFHEVVGNFMPRPSKKVFNIAHESTSAMLYTATILDREQIYNKYAEGLKKLPKIDYQVRGHLHKYYHIDANEMHSIQVPCWSAWYPLKNKTKLMGRNQPDIGFVIVMLDENDRSYVKSFVWNAPNIAMPIIKA